MDEHDLGMIKPTIAVDADDTIFDENNAIRRFMNDTYGFEHTEADYLVSGPFENYWTRIWDRTTAETAQMYERFVVSSYKEKLHPIPGALKALETLKRHYNLVVVTSRDHRTVAWTHAALAEHYPGIFADVHFVPLWGDTEKATKARICTEIGASWLIDDSFEHGQLAAAAGVQSIIFGDYGWNREQPLEPNMQRCKDWQAVLHAIQSAP